MFDLFGSVPHSATLVRFVALLGVRRRIAPLTSQLAVAVSDTVSAPARRYQTEPHPDIILSNVINCRFY